MQTVDGDLGGGIREGSSKPAMIFASLLWPYARVPL
jgi:hypothetical protein